MLAGKLSCNAAAVDDVDCILMFQREFHLRRDVGLTGMKHG